MAPEPTRPSKPNPNYIPPASVATPKEECLVNCFCGGKVELEGGTYGYPTYKVRCLRCGGTWSMDTYSSKEAIEQWNSEHNKILLKN
jgi:hypothetical protein